MFSKFFKLPLVHTNTHSSIRSYMRRWILSREFLRALLAEIERLIVSFTKAISCYFFPSPPFSFRVVFFVSFSLFFLWALDARGREMISRFVWHHNLANELNGAFLIRGSYDSSRGCLSAWIWKMKDKFYDIWILVHIAFYRYCELYRNSLSNWRKNTFFLSIIKVWFFQFSKLSKFLAQVFKIDMNFGLCPKFKKSQISFNSERCKLWRCKFNRRSRKFED